MSINSNQPLFKTNDIELKTTIDGSHTFFVPAIDETYHSSHGAIQESSHIFIEAGLKHCMKTEINILEIGFGTGLNAFLTLTEAVKTNLKIKYTTLELYPINSEKAIQLNYPELLESEYRNLYEKLHTLNWEEEIQVNSNFSINKIKTDFTTFHFNNNFDLVYFDAFSPEKQPEMWTQEQFEKIYNHSNNNAILTTYCAKGAVRRAMQTVGFKVERLPGPPGKREILRAIKK